VNSTDRERDDLGGDAPHGTDEPRHANRTPGEYDWWLHSVAESSSDIVTIVDPDGTLRYANPAWERVLGYDPDEAVGTMNVLDQVHPDDLAHVLEETEEALSEGGITTNEAEYRFRRKDGSWRWMESVGTYLLDDPAVGGVVVVSRDVTERKEAEEALRRSEAEIFSVLESVTDGFFALDRELRFTYVNTQAEVLLNRSREDLVGERLWEDPTFYPQYRKAMAEGETVRFEGYYPPLEAWYDVRAYPSASGLSVYFQDVTERKRAEERIRFQSGLLDAVGEAVIALDVEGRILYWNRAAEEMYGWSSEEAMGRRLSEMVVPEDLRGRAEEIMAEVREGRTWAGQFEVRRRDGSTFPVEGTDTPVFDEDGRLVGVIGVLREITGRKESEERLREAEERYRTLVETVPAVTYTDRAVGSYPDMAVYTSPQIEALVGYSVEEWLDPERNLWEERLHPEDRAWVLAADERSKATGEPFAEEYRLIAKDGRVVWVRDEAALTRNEAGEPLYWQGVLVDATDRKEAESRLREAEQRYRTLVEQIPAVTFVDRVEGSTVPLYVSPQVEQMLGYTPEEWMAGRLWRERLHPEDRERVLASDERFEADGGRVDEEYRLLSKDGSVVWVREETVLVRGEGGEPLYVQGILTDVTERKVAEEAMKESERSLAAAQRIAHVGNFEYSVEKDEARWSDELYRIFGFAPQQFVPTYKTFLRSVHPDDRSLVKGAVREALFGERQPAVDYRIVRRDGGVRVVRSDYEVVRNASGRAVKLVGTVHDITERKTLEEKLEHQAFHDPLTGLPNRRLLLDRLGQAVRRTRRRRGRRVAVLFMDLEDFKSINDSLGHEAGDLLLVVVAERLKRCLRPEDTLARFGGDEFVVLLEGVGGPEEAVRVVERITEGLGDPFLVDGRELFVSASIGIALGEARTESPDDLIRNADTAMYEAKSGAASGYRVFDPAMHERVLDRLELESDLRLALEREELRLYYQPKVRLTEDDGEIAEVEALLRWEHPHRGLLLPGEFIPLAEETGLIVPIGRWVLRETCRQVKEWQDRYPKSPPLVACVNVSAGQLRYPELLEDVGLALRESGIEGRSLALEITESALVKEVETSMTLLKELGKEGVRFALDDFGSEYSSLSYLIRLPVDFVKIDKSFVQDLGEDPRAATIVEAMISLAHSLGLEVVGEGVESAEQLGTLGSMGCDLVQGFLLARPLPGEEVEQLLADRFARLQGDRRVSDAGG